MSSYYRQQLEEWLSELEVEADAVLDIGGIQWPVHDRTKSFQVKSYGILDLPEWDLDTDWLNRKYKIKPSADIVFCLEVFEYLINPVQAIKNIYNALKPGGLAYITVPLVYPVHNEVEFDSLRYTENGFKRLCKTTGFGAEVVKYRQDKSGLLQAFYSADKMHPAKGVVHNVTGYIFEVRK